MFIDRPHRVDKLLVYIALVVQSGAGCASVVEYPNIPPVLPIEVNNKLYGVIVNATYV